MNEDVRSILMRLRARDWQELAAYGADVDAAVAAFTAPAVLARVFTWRGVPAAVVTFHPLTPRALVVSMMATDDWPSVARDMVRWGLREARPLLLARGFTRAECRTMEGHRDAIRLLEWLGFVRECRCPCFGVDGASFLQYAWRIDDHVHVQVAEGATAATPAADTGVEAGGGAERTPPPCAAAGATHPTVCARRRHACECDAAKDATGCVRGR